MRTDVGSIPLMCLLSTLTSTVLGYLPTEDLTNALPGSIPTGRGGFPTDGMISGNEIEEEIGSPEDETDSDNDSIYRKKVTTFRRRNINSPYAGRVPFSRMAYKTGYGSNRFTGGAPRAPPGGMYGERERNPYGTVNLGGGYQPHPVEEYNMRPGPPYSGLIGGSRSGYYGSTVGMRRPPTITRKPKLPADYTPESYPSNDLMSSFNGNGAIPSLRELATYASRYGPAYLRDRFGASESNLDRPPLPFEGPQIPHIPRGGGGPADFSLNIASNQWNRGQMGNHGIMSRDVDSYQHDDAAKKSKNIIKPRSATSETSSSSTSTSSPTSSSSTTTTTTSNAPTKTKKKMIKKARAQPNADKHSTKKREKDV